MYAFLFANTRSTKEVLAATNFVRALINKDDDWAAEVSVIKEAVAEKILEYPSETDVILIDILCYITGINTDSTVPMADIISKIFPEDLIDRANVLVPYAESLVRLRYSKTNNSAATIRKEHALLTNASRLGELAVCRLLLNIAMQLRSGEWDDVIMEDIINRLKDIGPELEQQLVNLLRQI